MDISRVHIGPSVLAADMSNLTNETISVIESGADYIHLDVMDGHFVPNISFGPQVIKCLRDNIPNVVFDAHLMCSEPWKWITPIYKAGVDICTFHIECTSDDQTKNTVQMIKQCGMKCGIAINPSTPVEEVIPFCNEIDLLLVMSVQPGFSGQTFNQSSIKKVKEIRNRFPSLCIQIDGGINIINARDVRDAGANMIVAGSSIFKSDDKKTAIDSLRGYCK